MSTVIIGHVGGAFKPFHAGHYALVEQALKDGCSEVRLYVSPSKREEVTIEQMRVIFETILMPSFKFPCKVQFSESSPVKDILVNLKFMDGESYRHLVYSDETDAKRFSPQQVTKFSPTLVTRGLVESRVVPRADTLNGVSGTKMRECLRVSALKQTFMGGLPHILDDSQREKVWDILRGSGKPV